MKDTGEVHTVFVGSRREQTNNINPLNRWQGYIGGSKKDFQI